MSNQINSTNTPTKYDAGDMHDLASLAEYDMNWMQIAINRIRRDFLDLSKKLQQQGVHSVYFYELVTHLDMYEYLAEDRHRNHAKGAEQYKQEWENTKGGAE